MPSFLSKSLQKLNSCLNHRPLVKPISLLVVAHKVSEPTEDLKWALTAVRNVKICIPDLLRLETLYQGQSKAKPLQALPARTRGDSVGQEQRLSRPEVCRVWFSFPDAVAWWEPARRHRPLAQQSTSDSRLTGVQPTHHMTRSFPLSQQFVQESKCLKPCGLSDAVKSPTKVFQILVCASQQRLTLNHLVYSAIYIKIHNDLQPSCWERWCRIRSPERFCYTQFCSKRSEVFRGKTI